MSSWTSPASVAIKDQLFRALAVLRWILLVNAVVVDLLRFDQLARPVAGVGCLVVMVLWTAFTTWAYADRRRRRLPLLVADLAIAVGLLAITPVVTGAEDTASIPGFWVTGALFAWAIQYRVGGGLLAGVLLAGADLQRQSIDASDYGNAFLLVIAGPVVGFMCDSLQRMATGRDRAEHEAAVAAERARLARVVHDGVLQVLALVQRRGAELGGAAADLGRLAGEQERELRALIRAQDALVEHESDTVDLSAELAGLEQSHPVTVSGPGRPVELPASVATEVVAATRACLDNVRDHVGADARAWVLLEELPDRVEVSVRDEGPGIAPGRLEEAAEQGRLGVAASIRGRVADLGGTTRLLTGPEGTEWEIVVPRVAVEEERR